MKIILSKTECKDIFHTVLCDGLHYIGNYGLCLDYQDADYKAAKLSWLAKNEGKRPCLEDVYMEMLKNGESLILLDEEGDMTKAIKLEDIYKNLPTADPELIIAIKNGSHDAGTADALLQHVFYGKSIFV